MLDPDHNAELPPIPGKRYFTIGEVSGLCAVKPHVLRYWEQEFPQLKPVKRRVRSCVDKKYNCMCSLLVANLHIDVLSLRMEKYILGAGMTGLAAGMSSGIRSSGSPK